MKVGVEYRMLVVGKEQINRGLGRFTQQQMRAVLSTDDTNEYVLLCDEGADVSLIDPAVRHARNVRISRFRASGPSTLPPDPTSFLRQAEEYQAWVHAQGIDVYHATTPFVLHPPLLAAFDACPMVATFYDVIPLGFPDHYLVDWFLEQYDRTLCLLQNAERLIAISRAAAKDAVTYLGFPPDRIDVAWPIPDESFRRLADDDVSAGLAALQGRLPIPERFILTVSHFHHSKNLQTLLQAYSLLPGAVREKLPLVICCHLDPHEEERLAAMVSSFGVTGGVLTTGLIADDDLAVLYNAALLVVHPSRYEGFGLPVVEAMSCGAPVITTTSSSMPEVAGDAAVLVDPNDADALADAIQALAGDPDRRAQLAHRGFAHVLRFNGRQLARRTLESYRKAVGGHDDGVRRPRIALFSPYPPQASGIADYAVELTDGLKERYQVEVFVDDGCLPPTPLLRRHRVQHATAFARRHAQDPFDVTLYQVGRSLLHLGTAEAARAHPGVVVLHDLAWGHVLYDDACRRGDLASFRRRLVEAEGEEAGRLFDVTQAAGPGERDDLVGELLDLYPMLGDVLDGSLAQIVHADAAGEALVAAWPGANASTVPMGVRDPYGHGREVQYRLSRQSAGIPEGSFVVGTFGVVDPLKRLGTCLLAFAGVAQAHPDALLLVVGGAREAQFEMQLRGLAERMGVQANVRITGHVSRREFDELMFASDVVVNLRARTTSHMSAVALRAAAAGKPVLLSDLPDWRSLPREPFLRVPTGDDEQTALTACLLRLASDTGERARLSAVARAYYQRAATVEHMAQGYTEVIDGLLARRHAVAGGVA